MDSEDILDHLDRASAVLTGSHFVYTNGGHGTAYVNMRAVAHQSWWLDTVAQELARRLERYAPRVFIGPETLGRSLAVMAATWAAPSRGVWCVVEDTVGGKVARFPEKFDFGRLIPGKRVAVVDDLLTTGSSIKATSRLVTESGGEVVAAGVVVRRSPHVTAADCGTPHLKVLADVEGFAVFTPQSCLEQGPCSRRVPVRLRPGYGWEWVKSHPDYPVAND